MSNWLKISETAQLLGVSSQTLRRWDDSGVFPADRDPHNGYRRYARRRVEDEVRRRSTTSEQPHHTAESTPGSSPYFVGRGDALRQIEALFKGGERLVTLTGVAGIGKSALARRWAEKSARDVCFCALECAQDVDEAWARVLAELDGADEPASGGHYEALAEHLDAEDVVLILDGIEPLGDAMAVPLQALLRGNENARFLVTSRRSLGLSEEYLMRVGPLQGEAAALLRERAQRYAGRDIGEDSSPVVERLLEQLGGIPLAIEAAAARLASTSLETLAEDWRGGRARAPCRVREALARSWGLLSAAEARVMAQLSVFHAAFDARAAEQVITCSAETACETILSTLIRHSLLVADDAPLDGVMGYRMYRVVAEYCAERLAEHPELQELTQRRHAEFFAHICQRWRGDRDWRTAPLGELKSAYADLVAASEYLASRLHPSDAPQSPQARWLAAILLGRGAYAFRRGGHHLLLQHLGELLPTLTRYELDADDIAQLGILQAELSNTVGQPGQVAELVPGAVIATSESCSVGALITRAKVLMRQGCLDDAARTCRRAIARAELEEPKTPLHIGGLGMLGAIELARARTDAALDAFGQALDTCPHGHHHDLRAEILGTLGNIHQDQGRLPLAGDYFERSLSASQKGEDQHVQGIFRGYLGTVRHEQGRAQEAARHYQRALKILEGAESVRFTRLFQAALGALYAEMDEPAQAASCFEKLPTPQLADLSDADRHIFELQCSHIDVIELAHALQMQDTTRAEQIVKTVRRRLEVASTYEGTCADDLRFARRLLERRFHALESRALGTWDLRVGGDTLWFEGATCGRVDLDSRSILRRILAALLQAHASKTQQPLSIPQLFETGWPGEQATPDSARQRVRQAIFELRELGLRAYILTDENGYRLSSGAKVLRLLPSGESRRAGPA